MNEIRRKLIAELGQDSWEETLSKVAEVNFVGFSLGNVAIESVVSQLPYEEDQLEFYEAFYDQYQKLDERDR